jgi:uncharacterized membrane protein
MAESDPTRSGRRAEAAESGDDKGLFSPGSRYAASMLRNDVSRQVAHWSAVVSLIALIFLCLLWEALLAPLRPGGSFLILKALPLLAPLFGILRGWVFTYMWTPLLALVYFSEGVVRGWSEAGAAQPLALAEIGLAIVLFASCVWYVRAVRPPRAPE